MTKEFDARNERKSRSVCAAMAEAADTGKRVLTEREREILDMWPKFEDGEPVMIGDEATNNKNQRFTVKRIEFRHGKWMLNDSVTDGHYLNGKSGERVMRLAPKVLDADGVEIKMGDTVYGVGRSQHSFDVIDPHHIDPEVGEAFSVRCYDRDEHEECHCKPKLLTHTRPDRWERLEEDAEKNPFDSCKDVGRRLDTCEFGDYDCDTCRFYDERGNLICEQLMARDIVRRAKKLAGVER